MDPTELLEGLGEKYSPDILRKAQQPISTQELSETLEIPTTTSYRRVQTLHETGLLEEAETEIGDANRERTRYQRSVRELTIRFDGDELQIESTDREGLGQNLASVWDGLGRGLGDGD
ncbi:helix-turn-helix domain-containing protein [Halobacteria archaeon AArc-dxtr1]|nr:helix-turn-helix domain-containing protein [Halobacteria archaeon AArc-dxtr1]